MSLKQIKIKAGTPAVFDLNPLTVRVNDSASWYNGTKARHTGPRPAPQTRQVGLTTRLHRTESPRRFLSTRQRLTP